MGKSLLLLGIGFAAIFASAAAVPSCADVLNVDDTTEDGQKKMFLCQLHESAAQLTQLSELVTEGVQGLLDAAGLGLPPSNGAGIKPDPELGAQLEKRKHEYLRFGKRKHEYLRFGKRKHEYLRFGKRKHEYLRFGKK